MTRFGDRAAKLIVRLHLFANRGPVRAAFTLLYMAGALAATLARQQLRWLGRALMQLVNPIQIKSLFTSGITALWSVIQQAETLFR